MPPTALGRNVVLASLMLFFLGAAISQADFVILKDGFTLSGKIEIEGEIMRDAATGKEFWIKKLGGFYLVNDGVRRMTFAQRQVAEAHPDPAERKPSLEAIELKPPLHLTEFTRALRSVKVDGATAWTSEGERQVTLVNDADGTSKTFTQCLLSIEPRVTKAGARGVRWYSRYLTAELPPATVLQVIRRQLAKQKPPASPLTEKQTLARFCLEAGWYAEAAKELDDLAKDFPEERGRVDKMRGELARLLAIQRLDEVEAAARGGQHQRLAELLADFPVEGAPERVVAAVRKVELEERALRTKLQDARRLFTVVRQDVQSTAPLAGCEEVIDEIDRDLNLDTATRLEPFVALALQEEKLRARGEPPTLQPEQLIALAVSGWLMGKTGAETDVKNAVRLCQDRRFLLAYLRTPDARNRERTLSEAGYAGTERLDVLRQLIELLPPPLPFPQAASTPMDVATLAESGARGIPYRLLLPPEYHNHKPRPVLIVLPTVGESPAEAMAPWTRLAAQHGYVLAAPRWADLLQAAYQFSSKEHDAVLAVLRDLRRRVNVDSERVFLAGFDQGANLAYDFATSHPDLFAGVVTICGKPGKIMQHYRYNAQYLPFYVIDGERRPNNTGDNRALFEFWVHRGFPAIYVEYLGRGLEFFPGELPYVFDWMSRKKRATEITNLGGPATDGGSLGNDFRSVRPTDNRFYWITSDDLASGSAPAMLAARVGRKNDVVVRTTGFKQVSIWLNPAMVDLSQPVAIKIDQGSSTVRTINKRIEPSLAVLLEDYYQRGDKNNLYTARMDFRW